MPKPYTKALSFIKSQASPIMAGMIVLAGMTVRAEDLFCGKVDHYVHVQMKKQHIPGLAIAVIKNGDVVLSKGYGIANVEHQVPVKPETIFQSGSVGKQFTATAIMLLVEDGKIALDDNVGKYIPGAPQKWEKITIRNLLTHTSGLLDYPDDFDYRRDYTEDELLQIIEDSPLAFEAGEKWEYSNFGYMLLGIIIHNVSGEFYGDLLKKRVFEPLRMDTAMVISEMDIVPNRAAGYRLIDDELKNQGWASPSVNSTADGSLYFSIKDMIRWDAGLDSEVILKKSSLKQMWTPTKLNSGEEVPYGFGWRINGKKNDLRVEHGGSWQGFKAYILKYLNKKLTVVVLANLSRIDQEKIAYGVAEHYLD